MGNFRDGSKYEAKKPRYRFIKINGVMKKIDVNADDSAFKAAMKLKSSRDKALEKEMSIHGLV